jgi:hypothetical protein
MSTSNLTDTQTTAYNVHVIEVDIKTESAEETPGNGGRHRSTIAFPYGSLKDAEEIAIALRDERGGTAAPDELAAALGTTPRSGTFRQKLSTTRIFGIVNVGRGRITLTDRGHRIIDPQTQDETRVEAFEDVPLFKEIYDAYKGRSLPKDEGLEQKIADLGVSPKQTARARQALQRSAEQAGYFKAAKGRLVRPATQAHSGDSASGKENTVTMPQSRTATVPFPDMWLTLLNEGESWSAEKTQDFVEQVRKLYRIVQGED